MAHDVFAGGWKPLVFIVVAGWIATDIWRWLGVVAGNRIRDDSAALAWVRAVATALVAAVVAKLILYPTGALESTPVALRIGAVAVGFVAFLLLGQRIYVGILVTIGCLLAGLAIWPLPPAP